MSNKEDLINQLKALSDNSETGIFVSEDFSDQILSDLHLSNIIFKKCNFYISKFVKSTFTECEFLDCNFQSTHLSELLFKDCNIVNCNFIKSMMLDVNFEGGFKTENNFTDIVMVDKVNGLSKKDLSVISDSIQTETQILTKLFEKWTKTNSTQFIEYTYTLENLTLSFAENKQMGNNIYQMILFDENTEDSIASDTITLENLFNITETQFVELFLSIYNIAYTKFLRNKEIENIKILDNIKKELIDNISSTDIQTEQADVLTSDNTMAAIINTINKLSARVSELQKKIQ